jgi:hypothetical protein
MMELIDGKAVKMWLYMPAKRRRYRFASLGNPFFR